MAAAAVSQLLGRLLGQPVAIHQIRGTTTPTPDESTPRPTNVDSPAVAVDDRELAAWAVDVFAVPGAHWPWRVHIHRVDLAHLLRACGRSAHVDQRLLQCLPPCTLQLLLRPTRSAPVPPTPAAAAPLADFIALVTAPPCASAVSVTAMWGQHEIGVWATAAARLHLRRLTLTARVAAAGVEALLLSGELAGALAGVGPASARAPRFDVDLWAADESDADASLIVRQCALDHIRTGLDTLLETHAAAAARAFGWTNSTAARWTATIHSSSLALHLQQPDGTTSAEIHVAATSQRIEHLSITLADGSAILECTLMLQSAAAPLRFRLDLLHPPSADRSGLRVPSLDIASLFPSAALASVSAACSSLCLPRHFQLILRAGAGAVELCGELLHGVAAAAPCVPRCFRFLFSLDSLSFVIQRAVGTSVALHFDLQLNTPSGGVCSASVDLLWDGSAITMADPALLLHRVSLQALGLLPKCLSAAADTLLFDLKMGNNTLHGSLVGAADDDHSQVLEFSLGPLRVSLCDVELCFQVQDATTDAGAIPPGKAHLKARVKVALGERNWVVAGDSSQMDLSDLLAAAGNAATRAIAALHAPLHLSNVRMQTILELFGANVSSWPGVLRSLLACPLRLRISSAGLHAESTQPISITLLTKIEVLQLRLAVAFDNDSHTPAPAVRLSGEVKLFAAASLPFDISLPADDSLPAAWTRLMQSVHDGAQSLRLPHITVIGFDASRLGIPCLPSLPPFDLHLAADMIAGCCKTEWSLPNLAGVQLKFDEIGIMLSRASDQSRMELDLAAGGTLFGATLRLALRTDMTIGGAAPSGQPMERASDTLQATLTAENVSLGRVLRDLLDVDTPLGAISLNFHAAVALRAGQDMQYTLTLSTAEAIRMSAVLPLGLLASVLDWIGAKLTAFTIVIVSANASSALAAGATPMLRAEIHLEKVFGIRGQFEMALLPSLTTAPLLTVDLCKPIEVLQLIGNDGTVVQVKVEQFKPLLKLEDGTRVQLGVGGVFTIALRPLVNPPEMTMTAAVAVTEVPPVLKLTALATGSWEPFKVLNDFLGLLAPSFVVQNLFFAFTLTGTFPYVLPAEVRGTIALRQSTMTMAVAIPLTAADPFYFLLHASTLTLVEILELSFLSALAPLFSWLDFLIGFKDLHVVVSSCTKDITQPTPLHIEKGIVIKCAEVWLFKLGQFALFEGKDLLLSINESGLQMSAGSLSTDLVLLRVDLNFDFAIPCAPRKVREARLAFQGSIKVFRTFEVANVEASLCEGQLHASFAIHLQIFDIGFQLQLSNNQRRLRGSLTNCFSFKKLLGSIAGGVVRSVMKLIGGAADWVFSFKGLRVECALGVENRFDIRLNFCLMGQHVPVQISIDLDCLQDCRLFVQRVLHEVRKLIGQLMRLLLLLPLKILAKIGEFIFKYTIGPVLDALKRIPVAGDLIKGLCDALPIKQLAKLLGSLGISFGNDSGGGENGEGDASDTGSDGDGSSATDTATDTDTDTDPQTGETLESAIDSAVNGEPDEASYEAYTRENEAAITQEVRAIERLIQAHQAHGVGQPCECDGDSGHEGDDHEATNQASLTAFVVHGAAATLVPAFDPGSDVSHYELHDHADFNPNEVRCTVTPQAGLTVSTVIELLEPGAPAAAQAHRPAGALFESIDCSQQQTLAFERWSDGRYWLRVFNADASSVRYYTITFRSQPLSPLTEGARTSSTPPQSSSSDVDPLLLASVQLSDLRTVPAFSPACLHYDIDALSCLAQQHAAVRRSSEDGAQVLTIRTVLSATRFIGTESQAQPSADASATSTGPASPAHACNRNQPFDQLELSLLQCAGDSESTRTTLLAGDPPSVFQWTSVPLQFDIAVGTRSMHVLRLRVVGKRNGHPDRSVEYVFRLRLPSREELSRTLPLTAWHAELPTLENLSFVPAEADDGGSGRASGPTVKPSQVAVELSPSFTGSHRSYSLMLSGRTHGGVTDVNALLKRLLIARSWPRDRVEVAVETPNLNGTEQLVWYETNESGQVTNTLSGLDTWREARVHIKLTRRHSDRETNLRAQPSHLESESQAVQTASATSSSSSSSSSSAVGQRDGPADVAVSFYVLQLMQPRRNTATSNSGDDSSRSNLHLDLPSCSFFPMTQRPMLQTRTLELIRDIGADRDDAELHRRLSRLGAHCAHQSVRLLSCADMNDLTVPTDSAAVQQAQTRCKRTEEAAAADHAIMLASQPEATKDTGAAIPSGHIQPAESDESKSSEDTAGAPSPPSSEPDRKLVQEPASLPDLLDLKGRSCSTGATEPAAAAHRPEAVGRGSTRSGRVVHQYHVQAEFSDSLVLADNRDRALLLHPTLRLVPIQAARKGGLLIMNFVPTKVRMATGWNRRGRTDADGREAEEEEQQEQEEEEEEEEGEEELQMEEDEDDEEFNSEPNPDAAAAPLGSSATNGDGRRKPPSPALASSPPGSARPLPVPPARSASSTAPTSVHVTSSHAVVSADPASATAAASLSAAGSKPPHTMSSASLRPTADAVPSTQGAADPAQALPTNAAIKRLRKELREWPVDWPPVVLVDDDILHWHVSFAGPADTPYEGRVYVLDVRIHRKYPFSHPQVLMLTPILHPCVSGGRRQIGHMCIHFDSWSPALTIHQVTLKIIDRMRRPDGNSDGDLQLEVVIPQLAEAFDHNRDVFNRHARNFARRFPALTPDYEEAHAAAVQAVWTEARAAAAASSSTSAPRRAASSTQLPQRPARAPDAPAR